MVNELEKMVDIFRYTARGVDASLEERLWVEGTTTAYETRRNAFMQAMVRREMRMLQFEIANIPRAKMDQTRHALLGDHSGDTGPCQDETIEMYI
jgi:hypothetical protein